MAEQTPVVLFAHSRPHTTKKVLAALKAQSLRPEKLIAFADGARTETESAKVDAVRQLIESVNWTELQIIRRESNLGTANNIMSGMDQVFDVYSQAIVIEDDVLPATHFYESLCGLLEHYSSNNSVFSVGAYPSLLADALPDYPYDVILSPRFNAWGWGTWADRWHGVVEALRNFKSPFERPEDVPSYAGRDLSSGLSEVIERPGFYWDLPIALITLHRRQLHALTRNYIVANIGLTSGTHGRAGPGARRFFERHNMVKDTVARKLAPASLRDDVCEAISKYIDYASRADRERLPVRRALRSIWARARIRRSQG